MGVAHFGLSTAEAWNLTMTEFMAIADIQTKMARARAGIPEPVTADEIEAVSADLKARGLDPEEA